MKRLSATENQTCRFKAERGGFCPASLTQSVSAESIASKSLGHQGFENSGCSGLSPVNEGYLGGEPGQIRDKFFVPDSQGPHQYELWQLRGLKLLALLGLGLFLPISLTCVKEQRNRAISREETQAEIAGLYEQYRDQFDPSWGAGALYARYSTRHQKSVSDQVRFLLETAIRQKIRIPLEQIYFDVAVSGRKANRPGLNQLKAALDSRQVRALLVLSTSRLYRNLQEALGQICRTKKELGIRCLFPASGIDTDHDKLWELMLTFHSIVDQMTATMYSDHVRASHTAKFDRGEVHGSLPIGYEGRAPEGADPKSYQGPKRICVSESGAEIVRQIFDWFVNSRISMSKIVRRLNESQDLPDGHRSYSERWTMTVVRHILDNARYRGVWCYGEFESEYIQSKDGIRKKRREAPLRTAVREDLRIIDEELWLKAQGLLQENTRKGGRRSQERQRRPLLLNGLFWCPVHDVRLRVTGSHGQMMCCPRCQELPPAERALYSHLNRQLALEKVVRWLSDQFSNSSELVERVILRCQELVSATELPGQEAAAHLRKQIDRLTAKIEFNQRNPGETEADQLETAATLRDLRRQRAGLETELQQLEFQLKSPAKVPTRDELLQLMTDLKKQLSQAVTETDDEKFGVARQILEAVTGGRIDLVQRGEQAAKRGWLRAQFRSHLANWLAQAAGNGVADVKSEQELIQIELKEPTEAERLSDEVYRLWSEGKLVKEIAQLLHRNRNLITEALRFWHESRSLPVPSVRSQPNRAKPPTLAEQLVDQVMPLYKANKPMQEIAEQVGHDKNIITAAVRIGCEREGIPYVNGRTRRLRIRLGIME